MSEQEKLLGLVQKAIAAATGIDAEKVTPNARLSSEIGLSSLDFVDVFFELEGLTGVSLSYRDLTSNLQKQNLKGKVDPTVTELIAHLLASGVKL